MRDFPNSMRLAPLLVAGLLAACTATLPNVGTTETNVSGNSAVKNPRSSTLTTTKGTPTPKPAAVTPSPSATPTAAASTTPDPNASATPTPVPSATPSATPTPEPSPSGAPGVKVAAVTPTEVKVYTKTTSGKITGLSFTPTDGKMAVKLAVVGDAKAIAAAEVHLLDTDVVIDADESDAYRLLQSDEDGDEGPETPGPTPADEVPPSEEPNPIGTEEPLPPEPSSAATPTPVPNDVFKLTAKELGLADSLAAGFHVATIPFDRPSTLAFVKGDSEKRAVTVEIRFLDDKGAAVLGSDGKPLVGRARIRIM